MNRNARFWLLLGAALIVVVLIVGGAGGSGPPYDPRSVDPDGARGIVETLERLGAEVVLDQAVPGDDSTTALLLRNRLSFDDENRLEDWVQRGGVLVVTDPTVGLAARGLLSSTVDARVERQGCTIEALEQVQVLPIDGRRLTASGRDYCFGDQERALVVAESVGLGTVVTVGTPDMFINANLDEDDAAVLAISLLAPNRELSRVTFIGPSQVDFGEEGLSDLVPPRVRNAIIQLLAAFLLYALYRSRRLGGVVPEPVPVHIDGSELVRKAGVLSERAKDPASAAALIRNDLVQRSRKALSIAADQDVATVGERIATATGADSAALIAALELPVVTEADLLDIATTLGRADRQLFGEADPEPTTTQDPSNLSSQPEPVS